MPWDGCELWVGELDLDGHVTTYRRIAGSHSESVLQPEWSPLGDLFFVSDRSGWWNLYRARGEGDEGLCPRSAELGAPQGGFGMRFYAFTGPDEIVCLCAEPGGTRLGRIAPTTGAMRQVERLDTRLEGVQSVGGKVALFAGSATLAERVLTVDLDTGAQEVVKVSTSAHIDSANLSIPKAIEFPTEGGLTAPADFYPPRNGDFEPPPGTKPPLVVHCHGGPTASAGPTYPFEYQYWTSRGIAVVDVNYGGSSGYGRAYRTRLNGNWGVVDVDDCINAARDLTKQGLVDGNRISITGGSAGGVTGLPSLTNTHFHHPTPNPFH